MRLPMLLAVTWAVLAGCVEPPAHTRDCALPDPTQLDRFEPCAAGAGIFGQWVVDDQGLPAYEYDFDQEGDDRALWELSDGTLRRDHLFQVGNDRINAVASNQGFVQLFARERGPVFLNRVDLSQGRTGGGYSYLAEGGRVWATAHHLAPAEARTTRRFGIGYAAYGTTCDGLRIVHRVQAPAGDEPFVLDTVTVTNLRGYARRIRHYEFWDVFRHPLTLQLTRSGELAPDIPSNGDEQRDAEARFYDLWAHRDPGGDAVRITQEYVRQGAPPSTHPSDHDRYPYDVFLARLLPRPDAAALTVHTDRAAFFGDGELEAPDAALRGDVAPPPMDRRPATDGPAVLVDEVEVELAARETRTLRYAYGTVPATQSLALLERFRSHPDPDALLAQQWRARLPYVHAPTAPVLHRELAWHAAQLQGAAVYDDYFQAHTIVQGSVYMYGHGLDGAARDFALFSVPVTYLHPPLARDLLRTIMRLTYGDTHQISYAVQGHGMPETAAIHRAPSDLDLFFLWALVEYVAATGDRDFLDDPNPYWPRDVAVPDTSLGHARSALRHLMDVVGLGSHGLIRVRTGDWSDGIVMESAPDRELAEAQGESIPNTQMAVWVLRRAAALFDDSDPDFAREVRTWAAARRTAAQDEWVESWYRRAWFGPDEPYGEGHLNLESQVWALIASIPSQTQLATLLDAIYTELDEPSPVGARRVPGGLVWHAITGLLTWGYARHDPALAWGSLTRHTLAAYAEHNPEQWYGIWSGPDALGVNGGTWGSPVTPMTDWPVMNANQHALPLLAMIRVAGIEPSPEGDGLRVDPAATDEPVTVDLPLLRLTFSTGALEGVYRALETGTTVLRLRVPPGATRAEVNGVPVPLMGGEFLPVLLTFSAGDEISFSITGAP
ncbi:MAG: hypothetical protein ABI333_18415 [bacterium]